MHITKTDGILIQNFYFRKMTLKALILNHQLCIVLTRDGQGYEIFLFSKNCLLILERESAQVEGRGKGKGREG